MALKDYEELAQEPLAFPFKGKLYTMQPHDIPTGIKLTTVLAGGDPEFSARPVQDLYELLLGPLWQEMLTDGVPLAFASRCGMTAMADFQFGRTMAEAAWEAGADPKAMSAYLVKQLPRAQRRSLNTDAANSTPSPGSTSGTKPRKP
jgi:hypothetical protein